jgi:hypothetical protein
MAKKVNRTADKISKLIIDLKIVINDMETVQQDMYDNWKPEYIHIVRHIALMSDDMRYYRLLLDDYRDEVIKNGC